MTSHLRFDNEEFWLDATDAAEVQRLCATDHEAGLSLARRRAHRAAVHVPMTMMDGAPVTMPTLLRDVAPSPPPVHSPRTTTMSTMSKVTIGDRDHYVDPAVYREIESLRGENAALRAMRDGAVLPATAQPVVDAFTASKLAAREAMLAQQARNNDPSTPQGQYREYLQNAHRNCR